VVLGIADSLKQVKKARGFYTKAYLCALFNFALAAVSMIQLADGSTPNQKLPIRVLLETDKEQPAGG